MNDRFALALRVYQNIRQQRKSTPIEVALLEEWTILEPADLTLEQRALLVISQEAAIFARSRTA